MGTRPSWMSLVAGFGILVVAIYGFFINQAPKFNTSQAVKMQPLATGVNPLTVMHYSDYQILLFPDGSFANYGNTIEVMGAKDFSMRDTSNRIVVLMSEKLQDSGIRIRLSWEEHLSRCAERIYSLVVEGYEGPNPLYVRGYLGIIEDHSKKVCFVEIPGSINTGSGAECAKLPGKFSTETGLKKIRCMLSDIGLPKTYADFLAKYADGAYNL